MGDAIGQILSLGVGVSLSPAAIIAVVLMLATPRGRTLGPSFLLGWIVALAALGTVTLLVSSGADASSSDSSDGVGWVKVGLGVLLLVVGLRHWRGRPRGEAEPEMPGWMKKVDTFTPPEAAGLGVLLAAVNPKNALLAVGAGLAIAATGASSGDQAIALAVFVLIGTVGPAIPVAIYLFMRDRADRLLGDMRAWMARSNAAIMLVICLLIGAKLIGDGIGA